MKNKKWMPKGVIRPHTQLTRQQVIGFMARTSGADKGPGNPTDDSQFAQAMAMRGGPQQMTAQSPGMASSNMPQPAQSGPVDPKEALMKIFGRGKGV